MEDLKLRSLDIENVYPLNKNDLRPRGQTALLDAMGNTIIYFINKKITMPDSFNNCIIYVATDGMENASKKYNNEEIKNLIIEAKKYNIELLYLGANQDAIFEAGKFGLNVNQAMNYSETSGTVQEAYRSVAKAAKRYRTRTEDLGFLQAERTLSQVPTDL